MCEKLENKDDSEENISVVVSSCQWDMPRCRVVPAFQVWDIMLDPQKKPRFDRIRMKITPIRHDLLPEL
jgi:hypothetical protein